MTEKLLFQGKARGHVIVIFLLCLADCSLLGREPESIYGTGEVIKAKVIAQYWQET